MLRMLSLILIGSLLVNCSPEHQHGPIKGNFGKTGGDGTLEDVIHFSEVVEKVFEPAGCFDCHAKFRKIESVLKTVIPGDAENSKLFIRSRTDMPPIEEGYLPLEQDQIDLIRDWINDGAQP